jgi:hypothetical protein
MRYRWKMAPSSSGSSSGGGGSRDGGGGVVHYGIGLARAVGMPRRILERAQAVAELLESEQRARADGAGEGGEGGGGGGAAVMREVYSLVHKLGCVARECGASAAGRRGGSGDGDAGGEKDQLQQHEGDLGPGEAAEDTGTQPDAAAVAAVMPLLVELKAQAERLCFRQVD